MRTETKGKEQYEVPRTEILEAVNEGIICSSVGTAGIDFTEGATYGDSFEGLWGE